MSYRRNARRKSVIHAILNGKCERCGKAFSQRRTRWEAILPGGQLIAIHWRCGAAGEWVRPMGSDVIIFAETSRFLIPDVEKRVA